MYHFGAGVLVLYQRMELYQEIVSHYMEQQEYKVEREREERDFLFFFIYIFIQRVLLMLVLRLANVIPCCGFRLSPTLRAR